MWFLNRARGGGIKYGSIYASLAVGLLFGILTLNPYIGLACAIGYNLGERMGWGLWVGNLTDHRNNTLPDDGEGKNNGIQWLARKIVPDYATNMINYCRVALTIRGIYWWLPTLAPLYFVGFNPYYLAIAVVLLGVGFPLACEIGYRTQKLFSVNKPYFQMTGGWEHQEVWYGVIQDLVFIGLAIIYWIGA